MRNSTLLFTLFLLISCAQTAPTATTDPHSDPIDYSIKNLAEFMLENEELNAVSIGIYHEGESRTAYFGEVDPGKGNPATDESIFEIASVTKTFTGMLVANAVLDNKLSLEDDVRIHLEGKFKGLEFGGRPIRIRDLLTHSSGITREASMVLSKIFADDATEEDLKAIQNYTQADLVADLEAFKLDTTPGLTYDYSPIVAPEMVAMVLEKVYGRSYNSLLQEFILDRAKLTSTFTQVPASKTNNMVNGYTDEGALVAPAVVPIRGAGGGLKSTVPDLLRYVKYLMESDDPAITEMKKPLFTDEDDDEYGYFWQVSGTDFMHNGGTRGSTLWLVVLPEYNAGLTIIFNTNGDKSGRLINRAVNFLYDDLEFYPKKNPYFLYRKEILANAEDGINFYHRLKKEEQENYIFTDPSPLNRIGYELLRLDRVPEAISVFKLLVSEFPDLANAYDSLGEGYLANKEYDLSVQNYRKSLELNPENDNATIMMEKIEELRKE